MVEVTIIRSGEISASHFLVDYDGKCANAHGHNWIYTAKVTGSVRENGMVIDFSTFKLIESIYDHKVLNDVMEVNPTLEHLAMLLCYNIKHSHQNVSVVEIDISETTNNRAQFKLTDGNMTEVANYLGK